jgi:hypothetical protein
MDTPPSDSKDVPPSVVWATLLPGSDRKQTPSRYVFRLQYCNMMSRAVGCVMTWEVQGGRHTYQVAVERQAGGKLRCHCTCADAVFRAENEGRCCKHVKAFFAWARPRHGDIDVVPPIRRGA